MKQAFVEKQWNIFLGEEDTVCKRERVILF